MGGPCEDEFDETVEETLAFSDGWVSVLLPVDSFVGVVPGISAYGASEIADIDVDDSIEEAVIWRCE